MTRNEKTQDGIDIHTNMNSQTQNRGMTSTKGKGPQHKIDTIENSKAPHRMTHQNMTGVNATNMGLSSTGGSTKRKASAMSGNSQAIQSSSVNKRMKAGAGSLSVGRRDLSHDNGSEDDFATAGDDE